MKRTAAVILLVLLGSCKSPNARRPVSQATSSFIDESIERNKKLVAYEEGLIQDIIERDTANNYLTSKSGFWYYYNNKKIAPAEKPQFGDKVIFRYNILRLDGSPIYTREEIGMRTYVIDKESLFTGLRQGLKLMKEGETVTFLFPSYKAFGYYGDNERIGVNVPIKSTVTLDSIQDRSEMITGTDN